jgi:hypothetical protein
MTGRSASGKFGQHVMGLRQNQLTRLTHLDMHDVMTVSEIEKAILDRLAAGIHERLDGQRVYPAWQFNSDGKPLPGLPAVLRVLLPATDAWTAAIWLTTPSERLGGKSAVGLLAENPAASEQVAPLALVLDGSAADGARPSDPSPVPGRAAAKAAGIAVIDPPRTVPISSQVH